jgi:hypothetical protein
VSFPPAALGAFQAQRCATLARLRRVNAVLDRWAEYEAAAEMPEDLRSIVEPPVLSRAALEDLRGMLHGVLDELEEQLEAASGMRERRN